MTATMLSYPLSAPPPQTQAPTQNLPWLPTPELASQFPILRHLLSCTSMRHLHQIHSHTLTSGAFRDPFVASRVLSFAALSPAGSLHYARLIFSRIPSPDAFTADALLRGYVARASPIDALLFYADVLRSSVRDFPSPHTFPLLLRACAGMPSLQLGETVHAQALKLGFTSQTPTQNFLVRMYASRGLVDRARFIFDGVSERNDASVNMMMGGYLSCGRVEEARKLFDEMAERNVIAWSVMIDGYLQSSQFKEALELFREMLKQRLEPNESILVNILCACAHFGAIEQGLWVEEYIRRKNTQVTVRIGTALVDMYLKCGCVEKAFERFDSMEEKNVTTWSAMISGLAINGRARDALHLFAEMEANGVLPNEVCFIGVLNACSHAGLVDDGVKYFKAINNVYGLEPNVQHYCCLVDLYGRAGLLDKSEEVIEQMPMKPNSAVWGALLNSCRIHKNDTLAERISKQLLELEPRNSGRYVLLSNIYAAKGRWAEVAELRRLMKERGVTKTPGSSFINLKGSVHEFIAGDNAHPQRREIYAKLDEMSRKVRVAGHEPSTDQVLIEMDEGEKGTALHHHSEKQALAFGLINGEPGNTIRIMKNLRICEDCHSFTKISSKTYECEIVVRDRNRFHHFRDGVCSCMDFW
ncbi:pentatricopeptide repeat-containing protein At5g66520-like [Zingiber officinale]|uniref:DYW domain-containing protein n=1 Tax=Zingiber officinale TaxID=94328 RepID=A0A8J5LYV1_ZINOF|nr:pentatricopeptide repeat-containing protein At5g66520-like [Zingiber officinale]KAG6537001.1 hypothetical protein ZIOFF_002079 [Zingiber officinale]